MKRFSKTPQAQAQTYFFQQRALRKRKLEETIAREQHRKRFHQVTIFRQYRQGELPDVASITVKSLVEPLTALAWRDDLLSRYLLTCLVQSIASDKSTEVIAHVRDLMDSSSYDLLAFYFFLKNIPLIFRSCRCISTPFIYWLLRVIYDAESPVSIAPKLVGRVSLQSYNYHMGVLLLEKQIIELTERSQTSAGRRRGKVPASDNEVRISFF